MLDRRIDSRNRRATQRFKHHGAASIRRESPGSILRGSIIDLSLGGCLLQFNTPFSFDPNEMVEVTLRSNYLSFLALGRICRQDHYLLRVGIEFGPVGSRAQADLRDLMAELESRQTPV